MCLDLSSLLHLQLWLAGCSPSLQEVVCLEYELCDVWVKRGSVEGTSG